MFGINNCKYFTTNIKVQNNNNNNTDNENSGSTNDVDEVILSADEDESPMDELSCRKCIERRNRKLTILEHCNFIINTIGDIGWLLVNPDDLSLSDYTKGSRIDRMIETTETNSNAFCKKGSNTARAKLNNVVFKLAFFTIRMLLKVMKIARNLLVLAYFMFILVANLPYATVRNFIILLKCLSGTNSLTLVPFRLPFALYYRFINLLQNSFVCRKPICVRKCGSKCFNLSNSESLDLNNNRNKSRTCEKSECRSGYCTDPKKCFFFFALTSLITIYFFCRNHPDASVCRFKLIIHTMKVKIIEQFQGLYMFPGEDCMKAGRCCKGKLEAIFRWSACFSTIPIRIILAAWPKTPPEEISIQDPNIGLKMYVDKLMEELNEIKEEMTDEEQYLLTVHTRYIELEQKVHEKTTKITKLKPKFMKIMENIDHLAIEIRKEDQPMREITTLRNDADKMLDNVRIEAKDNVEIMKTTVQRLRTSIEAEHTRLKTQIKNLEKLLAEDQKKATEKNERIISRLETEVLNIEKMQIDMKKRLQPLIELTHKYKDMSDHLYKELRNKLNEEMAHHEQMSKRTEKFCQNGADKLNEDFKKVQQELTCYINTTLNKEIENMKQFLLRDIMKTLNERTKELSRITVDQALSRQRKDLNKMGKHEKKITKCGLYPTLLLRIPTNDSKLNPVCIDIINSTNLCPNSTETPNSTWTLFEENENKTKDLVDELLEESLKIMAADTIGRADFALESAGATVILDRSSESYNGRQTFISMFGLSFATKTISSINQILKPGNLPGECWAFKGGHGHVVIKLAHQIYIDSITIDHVHKSLTPSGEIPSAPKDFIVYGLNQYDDTTGIELGTFQYDKDGDPIQTFHINEKLQQHYFQHVKFQFLSNQGNEEYTCIYRIRVHGNRKYG